MNENSEILKIKKLGKQIRSNILKMSLVAGASSSHFGGALSTVEILATLYNSVLKHCLMWSQYIRSTKD